MKCIKAGETICTARIKGQRYEIKRALEGYCGTSDDCCACHFFDKGDCVDSGGWPLCNDHKVYFVKIEEV